MPPEDLSPNTGFRKDQSPDLYAVQAGVVACERCPRLRAWCEQVAVEKRKAFSEEDYWGLPVPAFGDPYARVLIVGLAPAAHGANRTGRMFTGDSSGDWLYDALHQAGFASQAESQRPGDGLVLNDILISAGNRCAPPQNKPTASERANCLPWLVEEIGLLKERLEVVIVLGHIAHTTWFGALGEMGVEVPRPRPEFSHGETIPSGIEGVSLLCSYHPSRQNTNTGVLTRQMWLSVFEEARRLLSER